LAPATDVIPRTEALPLHLQSHFPESGTTSGCSTARGSIPTMEDILRFSLSGRFL